MRIRTRLLLALALPASASAQASGAAPADERAIECSSCAAWNAPHAPMRVFGNTYYVGTAGLGAVLVASPAGHVLIDGALPQSAARIRVNIEALGFRVEDVKLILNSHAHFDHAGGIAALQRASGAAVAASAWSAATLARGGSGPDDPQYGVLPPFPAVRVDRLVSDGETVRAGPLALTAHSTPGHTPGGTTWTWRSCDGDARLDLVYADSQTPVSAAGFRYSDRRTYPSAVEDFRRGAALLERLHCDVLITPHPAASRFWERMEARERGDPEGLVDGGACRAYAATARRQLESRLREEGAVAGRGAQPSRQGHQ